MEFKLHLLNLMIAVVIISADCKGLDGEGKLNMISLSGHYLEFAYFRSADEAVHVISEVRNVGEAVHLSVTSRNGEVIFSVDRHSYSTALWSFGGSEFLLVNETQPDSSFKLTDYFVPLEYSRTLKKTVDRNKRLRPSILNQLDHDNVNETSHNKIQEFLKRSEVTLLVEAAEALNGESGVQGRTNLPAMIFYTAALRFSTFMQENGNSEEFEDGSAELEVMDDSLIARVRRRRWSWWNPFSWGSDEENSESTGDSRCSNVNPDVYCSVCPTGDGCTGMCGRGCDDCWESVCGDCCWHVGCAAHDFFYCAGGRLSFGCIAGAPVGLVC